MKGSSVAPQYVVLQKGRAQDESFERFEWAGVEPAQQRRPAAGGYVRVRAQVGPVGGGIRVVLGMITVVETEKVVNAAVMAGGRSHGVFPVALQGAHGQAGEIAWKID